METRCRSAVTRFVSDILAGHDRRAFASGNARIDSYFHQAVSQDVRRRYATCYLLIERETQTIAGFYTLAASSVDLADIPEDLARRLPRYPTVPVILIGWLGRDRRFHGQRIGMRLLADALGRVVSAPVAAHAICADPIDEEAAAFYRQTQFVELASGRFYLPVTTAQTLFSK